MTFITLRRARLDIAIAASGTYNARAVAFARHAGARRIISFAPENLTPPRALTDPVPEPESPMHETERMGLLLRALLPELQHLPPPRVVVDPAETKALRKCYPTLDTDSRRLIGCHLSARRPANRWPEEKWITLIQHLIDQGYRIALFWSPGASDDPRHPGDDALAKQISQALPEGSVTPIRTTSLRALMAGQSFCDALVLSDGGHMHLAAALGRPMVALFGDTDSQRWHPVGAPHTVLQPASQHVADISVQEVEQALLDLLEKARTTSPS